MDFRKLSKISLPQGTSNGSEASDLSGITPNILDALVPGYSLASGYLQAAFGLDVSIFVSAAVILLAITKGGQYLYNKSSYAFRYLFLSSVYVDEHDDLFDMMMDWLAATHASTSRRSVRAKTQRRAETNDEFDAATDDALDSDGMFDYNKWSARTPPRYEPYYGTHILWYEGRPFLFNRSQKTNAQRIQWGSTSEVDLIQVDCIGRSVEPIRELLKSVKMWSLQRLRNTTTIRHPTPKDRARFSGSWSKTFSRPSRPMDTVILDAEQKDMIINDMNEYLHPSSPKWYATRGIPYRRGYLFYGAPGTGKTSLSFALAGIFGLEIYLISLQEPTLTEGDLMQLFNGLPKRCIVLLEDVDAAGLIRDGKADSDSDKAEKSRRKTLRSVKSKDGANGADGENAADNKSKKDDEYTLVDLARELKSVSAPRGGHERSQASANPNRAPGTGISLSGLLNAIDGVASHEGRVLIMTTNHPEKLDAALVRPGRVDRRVEFALARKAQIEELFFRMYVSSDGQSRSKGSTNGKAVVPGHAANVVMVEKLSEGRTQGDFSPKNLSSPETLALKELAADFASHIPDDTYTPAEIQNHLMRYKKEPMKAVEKVDEWIRETLAARDNSSSQGEDDEDEV